MEHAHELATTGGLAALAAAVLIGITCATTGVYVVLRRMAFLGDALAHTVLPGLVVATLLGWNPFFGAMAAGLLTAVAIGWIARKGTLREDTAIGVVFTGMFSLGLLLGGRSDDPHALEEMLFGELPGVGTDELVPVAIIAVVVLGALAMLHKELELASFDPRYAEVIGVRTERLRYVLLAILALTVVSGIRAVGVLLTGALLVTPAAAASLLTDRLGRMMAIAAAIAVGSCVAGLWAAEHFAVTAGAAIVLVCTACFAVAWTLRQLRGY